MTMHLHMMQLGYQVAVDLHSGEMAVPVNLFGKMRTLTGRHALTIHLREGAAMSAALRKFFNYFPATRHDVFDLTWTDGERTDATGTPWFEARPVYRVKPMWRVLLNGKDLSYIGGPDVPGPCWGRDQRLSAGTVKRKTRQKAKCKRQKAKVVNVV